MTDRMVIRKIKRLPAIYVSECGRVFSTALADRGSQYNWQMREILPSVDITGYKRVSVTIDGVRQDIRLHRIICEAFNGLPPFPASVVRHLDGSKLNNRAENLAWGTHAENAADRIAHGNSGKGMVRTRKLDDETILRVRELYQGSRFGPTAIARMYSISKQHVIAIGKERKWKDLRR